MANKGRVQPTEQSPFLSLKQVLQIVPVSRSTLYLMLDRGEFPRQVKLGTRSMAWSRKSVMDWLEEKLTA